MRRSTVPAAPSPCSSKDLQDRCVSRSRRHRVPRLGSTWWPLVRWRPRQSPPPAFCHTVFPCLQSVQWWGRFVLTRLWNVLFNLLLTARWKQHTTDYWDIKIENMKHDAHNKFLIKCFLMMMMTMMMMSWHIRKRNKEKSLRQLPTWYATVRLDAERLRRWQWVGSPRKPWLRKMCVIFLWFLTSSNYNIWFSNWNPAHLLRCKCSHLFWFFSFFGFWVRSPCGTDRQQDERAGRVMRPLKQSHNKPFDL